MKKLLLACLVLSLMIGVCGCNMENNSQDINTSGVISAAEEVVLTDRQKEILTKKGLPADYEALSVSEKSAIVEIEKMLRVLEEKYGVPFVYAGYIAKSPLENQQLLAYPAGGDEMTDVCTVEKKMVDGQETYEDDYINILVRKTYTDYLLKYMNEKLGEGTVKLYATITRTSLAPDRIEEDGIPGNVAASNMIFLDGAAVDEAAYTAFLKDLGAWLREQQLYGMNQVILLKPDNFLYVTQYNYTDYLSDEYYTKREDCDVQR
ncbi:MAG: hypothetical protein Q4G07_09200 [Oscillospiraceae bacterium]|nr:hypothetical protein [Oscillospiraceae bacterium]